jgi:hypothetical protein
VNYSDTRGVDELERPSYEIYPDISSEDIMSFDKPSVDEILLSREPLCQRLSLGSSFGQNTVISRPVCRDPITKKSILNYDDTSFSGFRDTFQHLARTPTDVQKTSDRTSSERMEAVDHSAVNDGRKWAQGVSGVFQKTAYNTLVFVLVAADDIRFAIDCARHGRRNSMRIHAKDKNVPKKDSDWDVCDYKRFFDGFGDETVSGIPFSNM